MRACFVFESKPSVSREASSSSRRHETRSEAGEGEERNSQAKDEVLSELRAREG